MSEPEAACCRAAGQPVERRLVSGKLARCKRAVWIVLVLVFAESARGQSIQSLSPRGLQLGAATHLTVETEGVPTDTFGAAEVAKGRVTVTLLIGQTPVTATVLAIDENRWQLHVDLNRSRGSSQPSVPLAPDVYPLRMLTSRGITNAVLVGVDRLPQQNWSGRIGELPVALHGNLTGQSLLRTQFLGHAGQRLVADIEGQRIGSQLRPVLRLYTPSDRQLALARPTKRLAGDARLIATLPEQGTYRLELQDIAFKGPKPGWFRLKLGDLETIDGVYPLAVSQRGPFQIQLLGDRTLSLMRAPSSLMASLMATTSRGWQPLGIGAEMGMHADRIVTGVQPRVFISPLGRRERTEPIDKTEANWLPIGINGRLARPGEQDEYWLQVEAGSKIQVDLFAERWGYPWDAVLEAVDADGDILARADDQPNTTDPRLTLKVPEGTDRLRVRVLSLTEQGGPRHVYRLLATQSEASLPGLQLRLDRDRLNIHAGELWVHPLQVTRPDEALVGDIRLRIPTSLSSALTLADETVRADDEVPLLAVRAARHVRGVFPMKIAAYHGSGNNVSCVRHSAFATYRQMPELETALWCGVIEPAPVRLVWDQPPAELLAGSTLTLRVVLDRQVKGGEPPVRLSLMTSQRPPVKKQDDKEVVDRQRMLRLDPEAQVVPSNESGAQLTLYVPNNLPERDWSLVVRGDLLAPDGEQIASSVFTEILRVAAVRAARLDHPLSDDVTVAAGETLRLRGTVQRHRRFPQPLRVSLQLEGINDAPQLPDVLVTPEDNRFELVWDVPSDMKPQTIDKARFVAVVPHADKMHASIQIQSPPFSLKIVKPQ